MRLAKRMGMTAFCVLQFGLLSCVTGYSISETRELQSEFDQLVQESTLIYMSSEDLYPDRLSRSLAEAAGNGDIQRIDDLIAMGADVNYRGYEGVPPAFWAFTDYAGFRHLLNMGADPNAIFSTMSVIHWAAKHEDERFLQACLEFDGNPNLQAGPNALTPIFKAISASKIGQYRNIQILLESGADIDARAKASSNGPMTGGATPLMAAAMVVRYDVALELLKQGADFSITDDNGGSFRSRALSVRERFAPQSAQKQYLEEALRLIGTEKK